MSPKSNFHLKKFLLIIFSQKLLQKKRQDLKIILQQFSNNSKTNPTRGACLKINTARDPALS